MPDAQLNEKFHNFSQMQSSSTLDGLPECAFGVSFHSPDAHFVSGDSPDATTLKLMFLRELTNSKY